MFDSPWEEGNLESYWQSSAAGFLPQQHMLFAEDGVFTNLAERDIRKVASYAGCDLPRDWLHLPDDDPQLLEALASFGVDVRGHPTRSSDARST